MEAKYEKSTEGGKILFAVVPASAPIPIADLVLTLICVFFPPLLLIMGAILFWKIKGPKAGKYRQKSKIEISPTEIVANEKRIPVTDIHRLIIRNHITGLELPSGVPVVTGNFGAAAGATIGAIGLHIQKGQLEKLSKVSYRVDVESGGRATTLAGGLDETTSYGLMREIGDHLGFNK